MEFWNICGEIANVIATGFAALSIYLTIKIQRDNNQQEKEKFKIEQHAAWYNELVLNDIVYNLNDFIEQSNSLLMSIQQEASEERERQLMNAHFIINNNARVILEKIWILRIFSKKLFKKCNMEVIKLMDQYSEIINESVQNKKVIEKEMRELQKTRVGIIEALYLEIDILSA